MNIKVASETHPIMCLLYNVTTENSYQTLEELDRGGVYAFDLVQHGNLMSWNAKPKGYGRYCFTKFEPPNVEAVRYHISI